MQEPRRAYAYRSNRMLFPGFATVMVISAVALPAPMAGAATGSTMTEQPPTVSQIYRQAQQSVTQSGMLYHATIQWSRTDKSGPTTNQSDTIEQWIDAGADTARLERRAWGYSAVLTRKATFSRNRGPSGRPLVNWDIPLLCQSATVAVSTVLFVNSGSDCLFVGEFRVAPGLGTGARTIRQGQYAGQSSWVVEEDTVMGPSQAPWNPTHTRRLYLDRDTFLPLAQVTTDGKMDMRTRKRSILSTQRVLYSHNFVPAASVPARFFDPASIGWLGLAHEVNLELAQIPASVRLYWLGTRFAPVHGLPPLVVQRVLPGNPADPSSFFRLIYAPAAEPYGRSAVSLSEWSGSISLYPLPAGPGFTRHTVKLPHGQGLIIVQQRPPALWARASFGAKKILIEAPGQSPYSSRVAMEIALRALRMRTPKA